MELGDFNLLASLSLCFSIFVSSRIRWQCPEISLDIDECREMTVASSCLLLHFNSVKIIEATVNENSLPFIRVSFPRMFVSNVEWETFVSMESELLLLSYRLWPTRFLSQSFSFNFISLVDVVLECRYLPLFPSLPLQLCCSLQRGSSESLISRRIPLSVHHVNQMDQINEWRAARETPRPSPSI